MATASDDMETSLNIMYMPIGFHTSSENLIKMHIMQFHFSNLTIKAF